MHRVDELTLGDGFGEHRGYAYLGEAGLDFVPISGGNDDDFGLGRFLVDGADNHIAVHYRHIEIGDH